MNKFLSFYFTTWKSELLLSRISGLTLSSSQKLKLPVFNPGWLIIIIIATLACPNNMPNNLNRTVTRNILPILSTEGKQAAATCPPPGLQHPNNKASPNPWTRKKTAAGANKSQRICLTAGTGRRFERNTRRQVATFYYTAACTARQAEPVKTSHC